MRKSVFAAIMAVSALGIIPTTSEAQQRDPIPMPTVNTDTLMKHIRELSSETYEGRLAGSDGFNRAAAYVEQALQSYGIQSMGNQPFYVECNEVENCKFNVYIPGSKDKRVFTIGNEFCCAGMTGRGYVDAQMVFCGYGVDNSLMNDYKNVDVQGKVAVVLTGLPAQHPLPQEVAGLYTSLRDKARTAERHGAIGMLAVNVSKSCLPNQPQGRVYCGELPHLTTFPILQLTLDCAREIFADAQMPIDTAIALIDRQQKPQSFALLKKAEIDINARYRPAAQTANIVGVLPGTDRSMAKEYIVVGASLDGVGMQGATCLFPSADINASGVAAVLETARVLSQKGYRPKRSIVFVLFSGSELQYKGSRIFISAFPKLRRVEAFVNVQNVGHGDSLIVLGDNRYPTLCDNAFNRDTVGNRHYVRRTDERTNPRGDARAFDAVGIPSMVITTHNGMHHYHVPTDIWENIDRRILTKAAQLLAETTCELGEGLYQGRSPQSRALRY